ncbi:MAG: TonB-dependent receptor [Pseudomonadota bacterium]
MTSKFKGKRLARLLATAATSSLLAYGPCAAASDTSANALQSATNKNQPSSGAPAAHSPNTTNTNLVAQNAENQNQVGSGTLVTSPNSGANKSQSFETVVVTANKRSESLITVPDAVSVVQSEDLLREGATKLTDYAATVPGLNMISMTSGQSVVILRGITTGFSVGSPSTVSTYVDDVPYGSATASAYGAVATLDLDPGTLKNVEVLRGPQGTLYGAGAFGGVIKYDTALPSLTDYRGRAELDGSAIDGGGQGGAVRAMFDGPLVQDKLGITISGFDRTDPGFIYDARRNKSNVDKSHSYGGRIAALWRPTEDISIELSAIDQETFTNGQSVADLNPDLSPIYGSYQQARYGNELWDVRSRLYNFRASDDLGWVTLSAISSYQTQNALWTYDLTPKRGASASAATGIANLGVFEHVNVDHQKTTQELRLTSPDSDKFEWLGGLFYTHEWGVKDENFQGINTLTGLPVTVPGGLFHDPLNDSFTEYAAYGDLTYHFSPNFKLMAGLRYSSDVEKSVTPFTGVLAGPPVTVVGNSLSSSVTYLVTPSYNIDDNNMVYIRVASGFRPGGPTNAPPASLLGGAPVSYNPDSLTNYEVGYKATIPDQRMTLDVSAFDVEWDNIQVRTSVNGFFVTGNGSGARSAGLEATWTWIPIDGLHLSANAAYTDAYFTAAAPGIGVKAGNSLPDVPRFSANLAADYDFPLSPGFDGFVGGNFQYQGLRHIDPVSGLPATYVPPAMPSYNIINLHAGLSHDGLAFEFYVKNVGDSYGITRLNSLQSNGFAPPFAAGLIQPRTFGVSISKDF